LDNLKKGIKIEQTREAFKSCKDLKLDRHTHVMLGCPGETKETIQQTINFVKEIDPTTASFGILTPYPGTDIFNDVSGYYNEHFTDLSKVQLEKSVVKANRAFCLRPLYLVRKILSNNLFDELMRLFVAGVNIFSFSIKGEN
jgi:radical SAM superfamily enzyme YgiQ (UPF0313 family)